MLELYPAGTILRIMGTPWSVEELNIVGYADVLDETMLPSVVPPIFSLRSDPNRYLLPPYAFNAGYLCNATEVPESEIQGLRNDGEITIFSAVIPARAGFELFVDQDFQQHYEAREIAVKWLAAIASEHILEAEKAFRLGQYERADHLASVAISADDRLLAPLVIKAAVYRANGDHAGEQLMAAIALPAMPDNFFRLCVDSYASPDVPPVKNPSFHSQPHV